MPSSPPQHSHISAKKRVQHYDRASTAGKWIQRKKSKKCVGNTPASNKKPATDRHASSTRTPRGKKPATPTLKQWSAERRQARREQAAVGTIQGAWARFLPRLRAARVIQGAWQRAVFREFATLQRTMPTVDCTFCGDKMCDRRDVGIVLYGSSPSSRHHLTCVGMRDNPTCFICMLKWLTQDSRCPHCRENIGVLSCWDDAYPEYTNGGTRLKLRHRVGTFIDTCVPMPPTDGDAAMARHLAGDSSTDDDSSSGEEDSFQPNQMANSWYVEDTPHEHDGTTYEQTVFGTDQVDNVQPIQIPVVAEMRRGEHHESTSRATISYEGAEEDNRTLASLVRERAARSTPRLPRRTFRPEYLAPTLQLYRGNQPSDTAVFYHRGGRESVLPGDVVSFFAGDVVSSSGVLLAGPQIVECARRNLRGVVVHGGYDPTVFILPHYGWFVIPLIDLNFEERADGDVWEQFRPIGHAHPPISEITFRNSVLTVALQWLAQHTRLCDSRVEHERRLRDEKHYWNDLAHVLRSYDEFEHLSHGANMTVISADLLFDVRNLQDQCSEYETRHAITLLNSFDAQWLILDNCRLAIATLFFKSDHFRTLLLNTIVLHGGYHCSRTHERFALMSIAIINRMFVHNRIQFATPFQETCARRLIEAPDASYDELTPKQWMCVVRSIMEERQLETCLRRLSGWRAHAPLLRISDYDLTRNIMTIDSGPMLERLRQMDVSGQSEFATVREWVRAGYFV